jgi:Mrp family chromosome partitioning ATPase/capsular polysaccharide biosynthesis protein
LYPAHTDYDARRDELDAGLRGRRLSWSSIPRHKGLVMAGVIAAMALAAVYFALRPVSYTASSRILVDNRVLSLQQQDAIYSVSSLTSQLMDSQVEILRSEAIARKVIDQLHLLGDPEFRGAAGEGGAQPTAAPAQGDVSRDLRRALNIFQKRLSVDRVGQSYVIEIRMTVGNPQRAADITNSLVTAYLEDQAAANETAAQSASGWLRTRLQSLGTSARVLTKATAPLEPDGPGTMIILGFAVFCGLTLGAGLAFARDLFDRKLRSGEAVEAACEAECFGALPIVTPPRKFLFGSKRKQNGASSGLGMQRLVAKADILDWAMERPRSLFAHTLRRVRAAVFAGRHAAPVVLGITSVLPGEGKTVVAANVARLAAQWGKKVLLIDAVPYNAQLTKMLAPDAERGLPDLFRGVAFAQIALGDRWTDMHFLPAAVQKNGDAAPDSITEVTERFIVQAKSHYDLIVMDLPPIGPVSDVHELAHLLDRILLVVESGRCTHESLAAALANSSSVRKKLVGAVLNKADQPSLSKYADAGDRVAISEYAGFVNDQQAPSAPPIPRAAPREMPRPASPAAASDHDDPFPQPRRANASAKEGASPNA